MTGDFAGLRAGLGGRISSLQPSEPLCDQSQPMLTQMKRLREMGDSHVRASMDHVVGSNYMGSHWSDHLELQNYLKNYRQIRDSC